MSKARKGQKKPTAIFLEAEVDGTGDKTKLFFCFNCRIPLIEYRGRVASIVPGDTPFKVGTMLKCKGNVQLRDGGWEECGMYYSFHGIIYTQDPQVS